MLYEYNFIYLLGLLWSKPLNYCIKDIFIRYILQIQTQDSLSSSVWLDKISREVNSAVGWGQALVQRCSSRMSSRRKTVVETLSWQLEMWGLPQQCGHWEEKQEAEKETWQFKLEHNNRIRLETCSEELLSESEGRCDHLQRKSTRFQTVSPGKPHRAAHVHITDRLLVSVLWI